VPIRVALPKGKLLTKTAKLTSAAGWQLSDYSEGARLYHLTSGSYPELSGKILHEKDIPIQVAMGNYDLGICGLDWIQELMTKYPASQLVKLRELGYGKLAIYLAASRSASFSTSGDIVGYDNLISLASEYPNLSETLALNLRLKHFNVYPLWGAAETYPPENAELVLLATTDGREFSASYLKPLFKVMDSQACLVANKTSLENNDLSTILDSIYRSLVITPQTTEAEVKIEKEKEGVAPCFMPEESIRLALPDGHAQKHVVNILNKANIKITDYPSSAGNRRPVIEIEGMQVKVIRPQDMPLQVANGKFDVAITGQDWVKEHLYQFPASPIVELVDLKYSWVRIVAAIHNDIGVDNIAGLRRMAAEKGWRLRVASEYVRIADKYARDNHLGIYRIVPTWGATEAFLPDDADILIENTETGGTLKRHNLKIIETLFESTACLIANKTALDSKKGRLIRNLAETLAKAVLAGQSGEK
jgi:ATP phosphoribosyltransferase